jgi:hypothetical protein
MKRAGLCTTGAYEAGGTTGTRTGGEATAAHQPGARQVADGAHPENQAQLKLSGTVT